MLLFLYQLIFIEESRGILKSSVMWKKTNFPLAFVPSSILPLQELEYAQFKELERRVIHAYAGKYRNGYASHPSTASTVYAQPGGMAAPSASSGQPQMNGTPSSFRRPFNPVTPTPEQNRIISEAIIYVQVSSCYRYIGSF